MAWLTEDELPDIVNLSGLFKVSAGNAKSALSDALGEIYKLVSMADFNFIETTEEEPTVTANKMKWRDLRIAQGYLAAAALVLTQTPIRQAGVVSVEWDVNSQTKHQLVSPEKLVIYSAEFERKAKAKLEPYLKIEEVEAIEQLTNHSGSRSISVEW